MQPEMRGALSEGKQFVAGIVGGLAAVGFVTAFVVHVLTFFPGSGITTSNPLFFGLHVGIFVVFVPFILDQRRQLGHTPTGWRESLSTLPPWARVLLIVAFAYTIMNFALFMLTIGGTPEIRDGQYVLMNHGKLVHSLTLQEYDALRSKVTRGFSGHWLLFYLLPALHFLFGSRTRTSY